MAEPGGEAWQVPVDVNVVAIPSNQSSYGEGMTQIVKAGPTGSRGIPQTGPTRQGLERHAEVGLVDPLRAFVQEEGGSSRTRTVLIPPGGVVAQGLHGRVMAEVEARLAELLRDQNVYLPLSSGPSSLKLDIVVHCGVGCQLPLAITAGSSRPAARIPLIPPSSHQVSRRVHPRMPTVNSAASSLARQTAFLAWPSVHALLKKGGFPFNGHTLSIVPCAAACTRSADSTYPACPTHRPAPSESPTASR